MATGQGGIFVAAVRCTLLAVPKVSSDEGRPEDPAERSRSMGIVDLVSFERAFSARFDGSPRIFSAPGRVNLIGEHTDYSDGFVLPLAIQHRTYVAAGARTDRQISVHSLDKDEGYTFSLDDVARPRRGHWSDYCEGMARMLQDAGESLQGANLLIRSEVPVGAGLSSSAALEIATGLALLDQRAPSFDRVHLALLAQRAEHVFVGTLCGVMDQFMAALGVAEHALLLDCRSLEARSVRLEPASTAVLVCDSGVKHALASSAYNQRRRECEEGVRVLRSFLPEVTHLRDVALDDLVRHEGALAPTVWRRCRHVVTENARTIAAADLLQQGELRGVGELMNQSHESLRDDYEVSCDELEVLVHAARRAGAWGARMTGGGFGGCSVSLVPRERLDAVRGAVETEFMRRFGRRCPMFEVVPSGGGRQDWPRAQG